MSMMDTMPKILRSAAYGVAYISWLAMRRDDQVTEKLLSVVVSNDLGSFTLPRFHNPVAECTLTNAAL